MLELIIQIVTFGAGIGIIVAPVIYINWLANGSSGEHTSHQKQAEKCSVTLNIDTDVSLGWKGIK